MTENAMAGTSTSTSTGASTTAPTQGGGRRVVVASFVSLDGYTVGPDEDISWVADGFDPQMQDDIARDMDTLYDVFVFGRVTYDIFAAYWPHAEAYDPGDEVAPADGKEDRRIIKALNDRPKVVFSTTLDQPDWAGTRVVAGGVEAEVRRLKADPGRAIGVQGSASIVQALAAADLVDEYRLYLHPVVLGAGKPLFREDGIDRRDFRLTGLARYDNGVIGTIHERTDGGAR
jgi:dihydrofolate reductase